MTELGQQIGDGIALNPDAPQPPFPVWLALPARWSLLDTNPGTWLRSANELLDTTFHGSRLPAADRRTFIGFIEGLVADCQSGGACVSLLMVGRREGGGAASAGIHLAFADEGVPSSIGRVQDTIPRAGTRTEVDTPTGPAMLQRERMTMLVPGTGQLAALTSMQVFLPLPETTWTLAIATASAYPEITDPLQSLLLEMARSVRVDAGPASNPDPAPDPDPASDPAAAVARQDRATAERPSDRSGPRIADAFGSGLILRRLGGEDTHG